MIKRTITVDCWHMGNHMCSRQNFTRATPLTHQAIYNHNIIEAEETDQLSMQNRLPHSLYLCHQFSVHPIAMSPRASNPPKTRGKDGSTSHSPSIVRRGNDERPIRQVSGIGCTDQREYLTKNLTFLVTNQFQTVG